MYLKKVVKRNMITGLMNCTDCTATDDECCQNHDMDTLYSLFQKKRTFNSEFFDGPPGEGRPKIHMVNCVNGSCHMGRGRSKTHPVAAQRLHIST